MATFSFDRGTLIIGGDVEVTIALPDLAECDGGDEEEIAAARAVAQEIKEFTREVAHERASGARRGVTHWYIFCYKYASSSLTINIRGHEDRNCTTVTLRNATAEAFMIALQEHAQVLDPELPPLSPPK